MVQNRKRKLEDLTADEFLDGGFALATAQAAPDDNAALAPAARRGSERSQHRAQLAALQEQDPEFYAYLQQTDRELLEFGEASDDSSMEGGDAEAVAEASEREEEEDRGVAGVASKVTKPRQGHKLGKGALFVAATCSTRSEYGCAERGPVHAGKGGLLVTAELIERWCHVAKATSSFRAMRSLLKVRPWSCSV